MDYVMKKFQEIIEIKGEEVVCCPLEFYIRKSKKKGDPPFDHLTTLPDSTMVENRSNDTISNLILSCHFMSELAFYTRIFFC